MIPTNDRTQGRETRNENVYVQMNPNTMVFVFFAFFISGLETGNPATCFFLERFYCGWTTYTNFLKCNSNEFVYISAFHIRPIYVVKLQMFSIYISKIPNFTEKCI